MIPDDEPAETPADDPGTIPVEGLPGKFPAPPTDPAELEGYRAWLRVIAEVTDGLRRSAEACRVAIRRAVYDLAASQVADGELPAMIWHGAEMGLILDDDDDRTAYDGVVDDIEDAIAGRPFNDRRGTSGATPNESIPQVEDDGELVRRGVARWLKLSDAATAKFNPDVDMNAWYESLPGDERFAELASHLDDGVGSIVFNGLAGQVPYLALSLETRVGTPAAKAYARALRDISPYLAGPGGEPEPYDPIFAKVKADEGRRLCDRLDRELLPRKVELEIDIARHFARSSRS